MNNSIGQHHFLFLEGHPVPPSQQLEKPTERKGVAGVAVAKTGVRGTRFTLRSKVDQLDLATAKATFKEYLALKNEGSQTLVQDDYQFAGNNWEVIVLDVREAVCRAILTQTGGLNNDSKAWLEADWDLVAVVV